jgi:hypothetical protein
MLQRALVVVALFAAAACGERDEPRVVVSDVSWACSASRCTASFRLAAGAESEALIVLVRAYAGESVKDRAIVGEYREMLTLGAGQSRRMSATVETRQPANRVRVIVQRAH